jgi:hypothetical protein
LWPGFVQCGSKSPARRSWNIETRFGVLLDGVADGSCWQIVCCNDCGNLMRGARRRFLLQNSQICGFVNNFAPGALHFRVGVNAGVHGWSVRCIFGLLLRWLAYYAHLSLGVLRSLRLRAQWERAPIMIFDRRLAVGYYVNRCILTRKYHSKLFVEGNNFFRPAAKTYNVLPSRRHRRK